MNNECVCNEILNCLLYFRARKLSHNLFRYCNILEDGAIGAKLQEPINGQIKRKRNKKLTQICHHQEMLHV